MKLTKIATLPLVTIIIATVMVMGSVMVGYYFNASVGSVGPSVYLGDGTDYPNYNNSGLFQAYEYGNPLNVVNNTTIYFNETLFYLFGLNNTLLDALRINNTLNSKVNLWINGTLPNSITMYYSYNKKLGTGWTSGQKITLRKNKDLNVSFVVAPLASGTGQLTFTYDVDGAIIIVYTYNISANIL
ncbi:MAG: hypothetical protein M0Z77_05475 [Thermoplasmatales archaeon]|jgi:hypothetical protein|nr:hypothetical protein [Thermoplasmatales archaeon]